MFLNSLIETLVNAFKEPYNLRVYSLMGRSLGGCADSAARPRESAGGKLVLLDVSVGFRV